MNIFNLLEQEKHVVGIEINEFAIRLAFFSPRKKTRLSLSSLDEAVSPDDYDLVLIERDLPEGVVVEGVVLDPKTLGRTLRDTWSKENITTPYAIVSIPDDKIYSKVFTFPKALDKKRIEEAMDLAVGFQLPFEQEEAYSDWEIVGHTDTSSEVLFSALPKEITRGYVEALSYAGIKPLALESYLDSIIRSIEHDPGIPLLYTVEEEDDASIFVAKDGYVRFSRALPTRHIPKSGLKAEIGKIKASFESTLSGTEVVPMSIEKAVIREEYARFPRLEEEGSKWFASVGSAMRGLLKNGNDTLISLLPVKTQEAYAYQKAATFIVLIRNMTIGVSLFFMTSYLVMYFVMLSLSQTANESIATLSSAPVSPEILEKEAKINDVNGLTSTAKLILSETPLWSQVLEEFNTRTISGITILNISAQSLSSPVQITGSAVDRPTLNQFKKIMQESQMFSDVELPITNLEQKENIAFSLSFKIKDPGTIYYK